MSRDLKEVSEIIRHIVNLMSDGAPDRLRDVTAVVAREASSCLGCTIIEDVFPFLCDIEIEVSPSYSSEEYICTIAHEVYHLHCDVYGKKNVVENSASFTEMIVKNILKHGKEIDKLAKEIVKIMKH